MGVGEALLAGADERTASFEIFSESIDPAWVTAALAATGTAPVRRRKLPAEYVVWLVIGMGLLHDRAITEVVRHLDLVLPPPTGGRGTVSGSAVAQARARLGPEPLAALFQQTAAVWTAAAPRAEGRGGCWVSRTSGFGRYVHFPALSWLRAGESKADLPPPASRPRLLTPLWD